MKPKKSAKKKTVQTSPDSISSPSAPPPAPAPPAAAQTAAKKRPKVPSILLEGDKPAAPPVSGPGQRYALGPTPPEEKLEAEGELPESYGTQKLLLAARDPHWLYAHWDLSREQQQRYNSLSRDRHLILR